MIVAFCFFVGVAIVTIDVTSLGVAIVIRVVGSFSCSCARALTLSIIAAGASEVFAEALTAVVPLAVKKQVHRPAFRRGCPFPSRPCDA